MVYNTKPIDFDALRLNSHLNSNNSLAKFHKILIIYSVLSFNLRKKRIHSKMGVSNSTIYFSFVHFYSAFWKFIVCSLKVCVSVVDFVLISICILNFSIKMKFIAII